ncbi:hypothetical protein K458DRAFT_143572 [Lentithecium fluviatile CBS 122367]|uniref:Uncharacterized protein n=1 Tax=Lentithecium fluviatile CBS 122367 TaxID=1168545 RepID=A0A6G1IIJ1_9PLEO|nr:hypothetical protein K458DRAFT_143572 [Lentithecium fluviatile CBS 122367]
MRRRSKPCGTRANIWIIQQKWKPKRSYCLSPSTETRPLSRSLLNPSMPPLKKSPSNTTKMILPRKSFSRNTKMVPTSIEFNEQLHDKLEERENTATYIDQSDVEEVKENEQAYGQLDVPSNVHDDTTLNEHANLVQQDLHIHPVTVNYDSAELWLFKYHDYENSGDFLVEDESLASKPLSSLLDACRVALGSDVTDDMELGFRLDNFHNIELYQEHSSCAFISLEHLVSLYQQLHVQDGVSSPESFYMTLLFRPRVSALLNELSKAAAEGIGHVGLDRAISAGLTAFNAHLSHNSTEHDPEDWENDQEQHEEDVHDDHDVGKQAEQVVDDGHSGEVHEGSYDGHDEECHPEQDEESHVKEDSHPQVQSPAKPTPPEVATSVNETSTAAQVLNVGAIAQSPADRAHSNSAHVSPTSHDDEDDLIDYSDDELDPEADHTGEAQDTQVSASSSTVQGDDASYDDDEVEALNNRDDLETGGDPTHGYPEDETEGHVAQHGDPYEGFDDQTFGDGYVDGIEQEHELEFVDGEGLDEYPTEYPTETNDEYTNQYDDAEHEHVDQPVEFSLAEFEGNSSHPLDRSNPVEDNSAGADDFLDFHTEVANGQVEPVAEEDVIEYDDDVEDGAAGQAPVPASVAAKPVDTLSSDSLELSLQRLKRTIDEVGIDVSKATKTLDAKRPRV